MNSRQRTDAIARRQEPLDRIERVWCKDEWREFPTFRVPVDALLLNVENRRFAAERKLMETKLGHALDPENSADDEVSVISILLDSGNDVIDGVVRGKASKDYESLREDWLRRKQEKPFWIRPDGTVRNGNRRLAVVKRLRDEGGLDSTEFVEAIILDPKEVDEVDLFKMEQREQLTDDLKVKYTDINLLLALRDAALGEDIDWADAKSIDRVAGLLYPIVGGNKAYAVIQLQAIRFMDEYLKDVGAAGQYQRLFRQVERFRDVGKVVSRVEQEYPDDAPDVLRLLFAAVKAGNTHDEVRALGKIFTSDRARYAALLAEVDGLEAGSEPILENPETSPPEIDEDDEAPGPTLSNYPSGRVHSAINDAIDGFSASAAKNVYSSLLQALSRLDAVSETTLANSLGSADAAKIRPLVERITEWADVCRSLVGK